MAITAWSIEDVRAAEAAAMEQLPEGELMRRAAHGLALVCQARLAEREQDDATVPPKVVVLAGAGGNGGDALFAAADLAEQGLATVTAVLLSKKVHEPALGAVRSAGVRAVRADTEKGLRGGLEALGRADLVIDGMVGIGGRPHLAEGGGDEPPVGWTLAEAIPPEAYVVAVDLPSGTDPSGEQVVHDAVFADETVTFGLPKPVHVLAGAPACGLLTVIDIGVESSTPAVAERLEFDDVARLWPVPGPDDDKYTRGVLGVVAGGENYTGAPILAVSAAVCAGAGMVRYVGPPGPTGLVRALVPEAVHGTGRVQAWAIGSGLDPHPQEGDQAGLDQVAAARAALDSDVACLVDAGALDLLDGPRARAGARTLLTPHAGELARLLTRLDPDAGTVSARDVADAPVEHARRAARLTRATVLLKGSTTYVVAPSAALPVRAQADAPAWLATAGSGDVLAGLAGMLLAAGLDPLDAGALAALVHGQAGHEANPDGPVRALDVAHAISRTVARLLRRGNRAGY